METNKEKMTLEEMNIKLSMKPQEELFMIAVGESTNFVDHVNSVRARARLPKFYEKTIIEQTAEKYHCEMVQGFWCQKYFNDNTGEWEVPPAILQIIKLANEELKGETKINRREEAVMR